MDLFSNETTNLLPRDGTVQYYGKLLSLKTASQYLQNLLDHIHWKNDEAIIYGKRIITKRKVAWYGDRAFEYSYSNTTKRSGNSFFSCVAGACCFSSAPQDSMQSIKPAWVCPALT